MQWAPALWWLGSVPLLLRCLARSQEDTVLLLTGEDDFNALACTVLDGNPDTSVYRLAPRHPTHGVVPSSPPI